MAIPGIQRAIEIAETQCAESFSLEVNGTTEQEKAALSKELYTNILDALIKEAEATHLDPWAVFLWAAFGVPPGDGSRIQRVFQCGNGVRGPLGVLISRSSGTER
jgi:hypothetical protein